MNWLAIKMLVGDRLKYIGLIAGMAFAAMMIAQQCSIFVGLKNQTTTFIRENAGVDLWVMDDQVRFSEDQVGLPETTVQRIRSVEGVEWAVPLYKSWLRARLADGTRMLVIVVGIDDATLVGSPGKIVEGALGDLRQEGAVFVDVKDKATKLKLTRAGRDLAIGDSFSINDHDVRVVGAYSSPASFFWDPVIYTTYSRALQMSPRERNLMSFVMVKVKPGVDVAEVRARIEERTRFVARTPEEFEGITSAFILEKTGILVNFGIAVSLGLLIGVIVTGQTFFQFTVDNLRYFASLKAMGARSITLIGMVFTQVLAATAIAFGVGVGAASAFGWFIRQTDLAFEMPWYVPAATALAMLGVGLGAGMLSLVRVLRLEPGVVFKG
ncbi:MAG: ABC transporter permease [Phycisphaerales bacterium]